MFDIYIKNYKNNSGTLVTSETKMLSIPFEDPDQVYINSPIVKQDTNASGSFDFEVEPKSSFFNSFMHMRTILRVVYDGTTIFRGRVLSINNTLRGNRKIRCEDALSFLNDTQYPGINDDKRPEQTVNAYLTSIINKHNTTCGDNDKKITLGYVPGNYPDSITNDQKVENRTEKHGKSSWDSVRGCLDELISSYGGYVRVRYNSNGAYLDWIKDYFRVNNQTITLGKNLLDQTNSLEVNNIFTAVIPFGSSETKNENTIVTDIIGYNSAKHSGSNYITVPDLYNKIYTTTADRNSKLGKGYHTPEDYRDAITNYGLIFKTVSFPNADSQAVLWNYTLDWMINNYMGVVNDFNIKVIDKHQIGADGNSIPKYLVGDKVTVEYPVFKNGERESTLEQKTLTIKTITYDLYNPENTQITVGVPSDLLDHEYGSKRTNKTKKTTNKKNNDTPSTQPPSKKTPPPTYKIHIHASIRRSLDACGYRYASGSYELTNGCPRVYDLGKVFSCYLISKFTYNNATRYVGVNTDGLHYIELSYTGKEYIVSFHNCFVPVDSEGCLNFQSTEGGYKPYKIKYSTTELNYFLRDSRVDDYITITGNDSGVNVTVSTAGLTVSSPTSPGITVEPAGDGEYLRGPGDPTEPHENVPPGAYFGPGDPKHPSPDPETNNTFNGLFGQDNDGNWMVKINTPIEWTDESGHSHKVSGSVTAKDLQLKDIPSFRTKIASIDTAFIDHAYILNAHADSIDANTADINTLTSKVADIEKLTVKVFLDAKGKVHFASTSQTYHDSNSSDIYEPGAMLLIFAEDLNIRIGGYVTGKRCAIDKVIQGVRIVELPDDPTYTHKIQYLSAYDSDSDENWQDGGNFSGAATLSGKWSSVNDIPTYTITADKGKIKGNAPKTTVHLTVEGTANFIYAKVYANNPAVSDNLLDQVKLDLVEYVDSHYVYLQTNGIDKGWISTKNTYDAGVKKGWQNAYSKVSIQGISTSDSITIKWPNQTPNTADPLTRKYTFANDGDNAVIMQYKDDNDKNQQAARFIHGKYTSGHDDGFDAVTAPSISFASAAANTCEIKNGTASISKKTDGTARNTTIKISVSTHNSSGQIINYSNNTVKCLELNYGTTTFGRVNLNYIWNAGGATAKVSGLTKASSSASVNKSLEFNTKYSITSAYIAADKTTKTTSSTYIISVPSVPDISMDDDEWYSGTKKITATCGNKTKTYTVSAPSGMTIQSTTSTPSGTNLCTAKKPTSSALYFKISCGGKYYGYVTAS